MRKRVPFAVWLLVSVAASASTWFYMNHVFIPQQVVEATAHGRPRGNLSDLYARWLGARELLLRGRNPYSREVTKEIQQGYYGRSLDPSRPDDPLDQQAFAYPVYVVFLIAPTVTMKFVTVQSGFRLLLVVLAVCDVLLWLSVLSWKVDFSGKLLLIILILGWFPMVQALKLQQLTLLVFALLGACAACVTRGWLGLAGVLLALATIKPQLTWPLLVWLLVWAATELRRRWPIVAAYAVGMFALLLGAHLLLPGWLRMFIDALGEYRRYTRGEAILVMLFGPVLGRLSQGLLFLVSAILLWRIRKGSDDVALRKSLALVMGLTVLLLPMAALYNQVLLAPILFALLQTEFSTIASERPGRLAWFACAALLFWPWIATMGLSASYPWLMPSLRARVFMLPFYSSLMLPVFVVGLALLDFWTNPATGLRENATAE